MILATYRIITTDICKWSTWGWWDLTLALPLELQARSPEMDLIIYLKSTTILVGWLYFKTILRLSFVQIAKTLVPAPFPHRPTHHFKPRRLFWDYCTAVDNCQLIYSLDFSGIIALLMICVNSYTLLSDEEKLCWRCVSFNKTFPLNNSPSNAAPTRKRMEFSESLLLKNSASSANPSPPTASFERDKKSQTCINGTIIHIWSSLAFINGFSISILLYD